MTPAMGTKPSNPKDMLGGMTKVPVSLWPESATMLGALALLEGMLKYGRANWRATGVRASVYIDALRRHTAAYDHGEDADPDSKLPHTAHMLACLAILVDAEAHGVLVDDRQYSPGGAWRRWMDKLTPNVARLRTEQANRPNAPKHYDRRDLNDPAAVPDPTDVLRCAVNRGTFVPQERGHRPVPTFGDWMAMPDFWNDHPGLRGQRSGGGK